MQDIHSIGSGGGGRIFGGGGDRRLRPHNHQNLQQALKCPRCESLNTKFCYYNNYNLSQPRHFCKNCRRYWTKGGVLRNVPVGGGCRKTKRSSKSKPPSSVTAPPPPEHKSNSHSSSESSSLTATTTTTTAATEVVSAISSSSTPSLFNFPESRFIISQTTNPTFDPPLIDQSSAGGIFPEIGSFTSLMTSSNDPSPMGFNIADISSYRLQHQNQEQVVENHTSNQQQWHHQPQSDDVKMQDMATAGYLDQTAHIEFSGMPNRTSNGGLAVVDWQAGGDQDQEMFDLTGTVDQAYWSQTQWPDNDHSLHYLP